MKKLHYYSLSDGEYSDCVDTIVATHQKLDYEEFKELVTIAFEKAKKPLNHYDIVRELVSMGFIEIEPIFHCHVNSDKKLDFIK